MDAVYRTTSISEKTRYLVWPTYPVVWVHIHGWGYVGVLRWVLSTGHCKHQRENRVRCLTRLSSFTLLTPIQSKLIFVANFQIYYHILRWPTYPVVWVRIHGWGCVGVLRWLLSTGHCKHQRENKVHCLTRLSSFTLRTPIQSKLNFVANFQIYSHLVRCRILSAGAELFTFYNLEIVILICLTEFQKSLFCH